MKQKLKEKKIWHRFVSVLSCVVVFCTTYALILPAVTMERDNIVYYCDKEEHQHTDDCYESDDEALCGLDESGHIHDQNCYEQQDILDCVEDHEHTQDCYKIESVLTCGKEEGTGHEHSSKCYLSADPLCGKEVHAHSRECESNKELKETKEDWEKSIPTTLKEHTSERIVQIALSQKDYKEVKENFEMDENGHEHYYTRYGEWYGKPYEDWNVMFISFVLKYAGIKNEQIPYGHDWNEWIEDLTKKQLFAPENYEPKDGDLIFIKDLPDENIPDKEIKNYAGVITDIKNKKVVIGDLNGQVKEIILDDKEYQTNAYVEIKNDVQNSEEENPKPEEDETDNVVKDEQQPTEEQPVEEEQETIDYQLPENFTIENEDFTLVLTPRMFNDEEEQKEANNEETEKQEEEQGLRIKQFSLSENIQEKIDDENQLTKEELEQIKQDQEQEKKEEEEKPILTVQLEKINEQTETDEEEQAEIEQLREQSLENVEEENLLDLSFYKLRFFANDQEVDLQDQKFDAELTPTEQFIEKYDTTKDLEDVAPEAEVGTELSVVQTSAINGKSENLIDSEFNTSKVSNLYSSKKDVNSITFSLNNTLFSTRADSLTNPHFFVQTYGYINQNATKEEVDEYNKTVSADKKISYYPKWEKGDTVNGTEQKYAQNYLQTIEFPKTESVTQKDYVIDKKTNKIVRLNKLTEIYSTNDYEYIKAPNKQYFNKLKENNSFKLTSIWVLKPNRDANSTNPDDWTRYEEQEIDSLRFTNRNPNDLDISKFPAGTNKEDFVQITEGMTIRMIYDTVDANFASNVRFFDYDTSENSTKSGKRTINDVVDTNKKDSNGYFINQGINNPSNYNNPNALPEYGFGNANSGISPTLKDKQLNNHNINIGITQNYNAAFGIVNSTLGGENLENPTLNFNVNAPAIFSKKALKGKTNYLPSTDNYTNLQFIRDGDTYTLNAVQGYGNQKDISATNLDSFSHPTSKYTHIWTNGTLDNNGFWPLDKLPGKDGLVGNNPDILHNGYGEGQNYSTFQQNRSYPASDNSKPHNTFFGMHYTISFDLDEDYTGPLDYFFFGDDDMWVYLDNELIVDIGGVHRSVGAHVDLNSLLRDPITNDKGEIIGWKNKKDKVGKHYLNIFYTERGLSGSTCYMEFTLPSVSGANTSRDTGDLKLSKYTEDEDKSTEYQFKLELKDSTGNYSLPDQYSYTRYKNDGTQESDLITYDGGIITLCKDEYAIIQNIPIGAKYIITELDVDSNTTVYTQSNESTAGYVEDLDHQISGFITSELKSIQIDYKNVRSYQLPETGSLGIDPPFIAGSASVVTTSFYALKIQRKKRRKGNDL